MVRPGAAESVGLAHAQEDRIQDFEARVRGRGGKEFELLLSAQVIDLPSGPAVLVQGLDVTERKNFERTCAK